MAYSIAEASAHLAVHPTTVRRWIHSGRMAAELVDRQWAIHDEAVAEAREQVRGPKDSAGAWDSGAYPVLLALIERQLEEKDRQIKELHTLLQTAQGQTQQGQPPSATTRGRRRW